MQEEAPTQEAYHVEAVPLRWHTVTEVAAYLEVREDDLLALLPDTAIVMESWPPSRLSSKDVEIVERLIRTVRKFYSESVYGGGDL